MCRGRDQIDTVRKGAWPALINIRGGISGEEAWPREELYGKWAWPPDCGRGLGSALGRSRQLGAWPREGHRRTGHGEWRAVGGRGLIEGAWPPRGKGGVA